MKRINEAAGRDLEKRIKQEGNEAIFMRLDVSQEADWQRVMADTIAQYGKVNILVNNAGVSLGKDIEETTLEKWNWLMGINATGVFLGTKYAILNMKENGERCSIVNRSSIDGQIAEPGLFAYCASKGAVTILTKSAALACGAKGYKIRVNSVHPGYVHTALTEQETPMDIAYGDLYLASDESMFTTGSELTIDGGWTAQ